MYGITNQSIEKLILTQYGEEDNKISKLTEREIEIIKMIKNGSTNKEIAEALFLSPRTVKTHRARILKN
ncbi:MAG: response regulator transcription factor [Bacteroidetes bacterium]|nr:response regulator transcription factor [Bacteroidota bacterium]